MFSQIFFIFLALLLINFTPEMPLTFWIEDPREAFQWSLLGYILLLLLLYGQSKIFSLFKKHASSMWLSIVNGEILFFLALYHFGLGTQRFFLQGHSYQTPFILVSLLLYFSALGWSHFCYSQVHLSFKKALKNAYHQILFYFPFCLPFLIMSLLLDGKQRFPLHSDFILFLLSLLFLGGTLILFPAIIVFCWRCKPLDRFDLKQRLEAICHALHFRHAGLKVWSIMPHSFTAGIIGIIPTFRYILFTPALLKRFQIEEIEAILVHEIGHNYYKHLICYPFILLGMLVMGTLLLLGVEEALSTILGEFSLRFTDFIFIMTLFSLYALLMGLYFRLVFGFFSRLFERQADLHIFASPLSPVYLIQALDRLGVVTGYTHDHPSWHHFSLKERIHFLSQALDHPDLIPFHHRRVKKWLIIYFVILILSCLVLYWML